MPAFGIGPSLASYGTRGRSPSLAAFGQSEDQQATSGLQSDAAAETQRNDANIKNAAAAKQGDQALGSTVGGLAGGAVAGAEFGSAAGPWGTVIGGVVGALAGRFMS